MNFVTTPRGVLIGTREAQITLKTEDRDIRLELGRDGKLTAKSSGWDKAGLPSGRQARGRSQERPVGGHPPAGGGPRGYRAATHYFRKKNDAVTAPAVAPQRRCDGATVALQPDVTAQPSGSVGAAETGSRVGQSLVDRPR